LNDVTILIPAYNEAAFIQQTVKALGGLPHIREILVVDDGSNDNTAALAKQAGAQIISQPVNQGKGSALNRGLKAAKGAYVCFVDADLGGSAAETVKLYSPVRDKKADLVIASFPKPRIKGGFGVATKIAKLGLYIYTGTKFLSPLSGQRAMAMETALELAPFANGFGVEVGLTIDASRKGYRLLEVPVDMHHREGKRNLSGFRHRGRQCYHVARVLCHKVRRVN